MAESGKNSLKSQVISGITWKFAERLLAQLITFALSLILARLLSPEDYGAVAMVNIFIIIADILITSGLSAALIQKKDATEADFSTVFYCNLIMSVVLYAILFMFAPLIAEMYKIPELSLILRIIALKLPFSAFNSVQNSYVARNMQFKRLFFSSVIGTLISAGLGVYLAYNGYGAWALVAQQLSVIVINSILLLFLIPWHPKFIFSKDSFKSVIGYGSQVMATDLSGTVFNQINGLAIGVKYTSSDLAFYTKGQQLPQAVSTTVSSALTGVMFPAIAKVSEDMQSVKKAARKSLKLISYVVFPLMFGMAVISHELVIVLYTEKWVNTVPYMIIMCIDGGISVIGAIDIIVLKAIGKSSSTLKLELIKKPLFLILIIAAMQFGVIWIAVIVPVMDLIATAINSYSLKKWINYGFFEKVFDCKDALFLSAVACGLAYLAGFINIPSNFIILILKFIIAVGCYILLSALFRNASFKELLGFIKNVFNKRKARRNAVEDASANNSAENQSENTDNEISDTEKQ